MAERLIGPERQWLAENADHERYWITRYPTAALLPMMGMVKLVAAFGPACRDYQR